MLQLVKRVVLRPCPPPPYGPTAPGCSVSLGNVMRFTVLRTTDSDTARSKWQRPLASGKRASVLYWITPLRLLLEAREECGPRGGRVVVSSGEGSPTIGVSKRADQKPTRRCNRSVRRGCHCPLASKTTAVGCARVPTRQRSGCGIQGVPLTQQSPTSETLLFGSCVEGGAACRGANGVGSDRTGVPNRKGPDPTI